MATRIATKVAPKPKTPATTKPVRTRMSTPVRMKRKTAEAPAKVTEHTTTADDQKRREVAKTVAKEAVKSRQEDETTLLYNRLIAKELVPSEVKAAQFLTFNAKQLADIAKAHGLKGYSGLKKDELCEFLSKGGVKPVAQAGSTRQLKEQVAAAKKSGLVTGPVSSLKVEDLRKVASKVMNGETVTVSKPAPKAGTMDYNKGLLRNPNGVGYTDAATKLAKNEFGVSISALKSEQLAKLVKMMGLVK